MQNQIGLNRCVSVDNLPDQIRSSRLTVNEVRRGNQCLDFELVGVEHQPDERLAVVGFGDSGGQAADVGEYDQSNCIRILSVRVRRKYQGEKADHGRQ